MDLEKFKGNPLITRKPEEYVVGQLYYIQKEDDPTRFLITTCSGVADPNRIKGRYLTNFDGPLEFSREETTPYVTGRPSRLATFEEVKWYTACARANKLVPKEDALLKPDPKPARVIPTEKSYAITEHQLFMLYDVGSPIIKEMLEKWYTPERFHIKVGGNGE